MNLNWIILLLGIAGGAFPSWWVTSTHYKGVISREHEAAQRLVIEQQEEHRLALLAYAERIVKGDAQHDKDQITINRLSDERRRVRVVFPACPLSRTAEGGADSNEAGRALSNGVDAAFADFQSAAGSLVEDADQLNIDAIRQNARLK